jgi:nuclear transcription factor Y alpha
MPGKPETDDLGVKHSELPSSIYSHQPWWLQNASKSSSADQLNGSIMNGVTHLVSPSLSVTDKSGVCILISL